MLPSGYASNPARFNIQASNANKRHLWLGKKRKKKKRKGRKRANWVSLLAASPGW